VLSTIVPAYLYQQYADDEDLPWFIAAYNAAAQYYLDWFNNTNLAYYPGLTGSLLDWVADGLYGELRTSLAAASPQPYGPLNTVVMNANYPLNSYYQPQQTIYSLTDDAFKRVITWNFYKGDGKRFNMRWIKRRIMRFLLGVNGTDPQGGINATVGTENTQSIGVTVSGTTITVSIDQALLSSIAEITPGILDVFQLAFEAGQSGPLELPAQYQTFVCNIVTSLSATVTPNNYAIAGAATNQSTGTSAVSVIGGSGSYTYAWSWIVGGTGINIVPAGSPSGSQVSFQAPAMTPGNTYTGTAQCLITDTVTSNTTTVQITVSITCYGTLGATISPASSTGTGASASQVTSDVTVTVTGGSGSHSASWGFSVGGTNLTPSAPSSDTTHWTGTSLAPGGSDTGTAQCTITDLVTLAQVFPTCSVSANRVTLVSASASPTSVSSSGSATTQTTGASTASGSGGSGSYTFSWAWVSGGAGIGIDSPGSASTTWTAAGMSYGTTYSGTCRCTVTDGYGQAYYVDVSVSITCVTPVYSGSLTAATSGNITGYHPPSGSLASTTDFFGHTITELYQYSDSVPTLFVLITISGFSSDPGAAYFNNLKIGTYTFIAASAVYSYSAGTANWQWNGVLAGMSAPNTYPITINYV
jgi:hypothetical protein